ncbi:MAG: hypothetical protein NT086_09020 [Proteobacteria bacterium]|nr:hypothetical protein [Pseudomonadota bacterium]
MFKDESPSAVSAKTALTLLLSGFGSWSMNDWIQFATLVYLILQIAWLVRKHWRASSPLSVDDKDSADD